MTTYSTESKVAHFCDTGKVVSGTQVNFGFFHLNLVDEKESSAYFSTYLSHRLPNGIRGWFAAELCGLRRAMPGGSFLDGKGGELTTVRISVGSKSELPCVLINIPQIL